MQTITYFHGTKNTAAVMNAIMGDGRIRTGFHMTPDPEVAANYGRVIAIELEAEIPSAHIGKINKDGNYNPAVGNGIEVVLKTPASIREFYASLYNAEIVR
jgi:hypothetical protein